MIEILDTTLRDGEQTSGVSFAPHEKLGIVQVLLRELGVNRVEIASARVSDGEFESVKRMAQWAGRTGNLDKLEVLGFVDGTVSLDWIESAGCQVMNRSSCLCRHLCRGLCSRIGRNFCLLRLCGWILHRSACRYFPGNFHP